MKWSRYINTCIGWRPWNRAVKQFRHSWLYGGYVFQVVVKLEIFTFKSDLTSKVNVNRPKKYTDLNPGILHLWSKFDDTNLNGWGVIVQTSSKWGKFGLWPYIWLWRSKSIATQNNRDLNQVGLHLWSTFGDPNLNGSRVIARTSKWLTHGLTHGRTHRRKQRQYQKAKTGLGKKRTTLYWSF